MFQFLATTQKLCREHASLFSIYMKAGVATIESDWPKRKKGNGFFPLLFYPGSIFEIFYRECEKIKKDRRTGHMVGAKSRTEAKSIGRDHIDNQHLLLYYCSSHDTPERKLLIEAYFLSKQFIF